MEKRKTNKKNKGITLIILIITVIILLIISAVTVNFFVNDDAIGESQKLNDRMVNQQEEQQSLSNMVRNLYDN